jgi:hypothetical protein
MISDSELAHFAELWKRALNDPNEMGRSIATVPALIAEIERLQHENATCASALMIARDARHAEEKERVKYAEYWQAAEAELAATRTALYALRAELEKRK